MKYIIQLCFFMGIAFISLALTDHQGASDSNQPKPIKISELNEVPNFARPIASEIGTRKFSLETKDGTILNFSMKVAGKIKVGSKMRFMTGHVNDEKNKA